MSCFGGVAATSTVATTYSSSGTMRGNSSGSRSGRSWRWWRAKCAGIAASVGSRLRRSIKGRLDGGRRRRRRRGATWSSVHLHRSFAPVYVEELYYNHHDMPVPVPSSGGNKPPNKLGAVAVPGREEEPTTSGNNASHGGKGATARVAAATADSRDGGGKARAGVGAMRNILMRSPGRGGGGVLGVVKGMGEVDLRAELFIRKFKEDMRLQSQRSAEEFQAMLARGL